MKKEGKRGLKHGSTHPVRRFDSCLKPKGHRRRKRFIGNSEKGVLPDPLPSTALKILSVLGAKGVAGEACVAAKVVKSTVSRWVRLLKNAGALVLDEEEVPNSTGRLGKPQVFKPGTPRYYLLTPYGSKLITWGDGVLHFPILFEDRPQIFKVAKREVKPIPWKRMGNVRNWRKFGVMLAGVTVELHDGLGPNRDGANVEIHPGRMKGFNVDELLADSVAVVERVKYMLEATYGIELSMQGELPKGKGGEPFKPRFCVYRPEIREWMKAGSMDIPGYAGADASPQPSVHGVRDPLSDEPHFEYVEGKDAALLASLPAFIADDPAKQNLFDGLTAPALIRETHRLVKSLVDRINLLTVEVNQVKAVESQVSGVMVEFRRLADALSKLNSLERLPEIAVNLKQIVGVLNKLLDLDGGSQAKTSEVSKSSGGSEYVR